MKKTVLYILAILFVIKMQLLTVGCANIIPPEGGYRDTIPPELLKASPQDSSKQFRANRITFTFDEFVDLQNPTDNVIISPMQKNPPDVSAKLRTVVVKLKDTLEPNTTYTINFGNSIKDVNEGNVLKNFNYVFSTGNYFDSLSLNGKVILAETGGVDSTMTVMLYKSGSDSAVSRESPRYITNVNSKGEFHFRNLPAGNFYIYAIKDEGRTFRYSGKQLFAFADKSYNTQAKNDSIILYAFSEREQPLTNAPPPRTGRPTDKRLRLTTNTLTGPLDLASDFILTFEQPLKTLDTTMISLRRDTTFSAVPGARAILDSTRKKLSLEYKWAENTQYFVILDKDFAEDSFGRKLLKKDTLTFKTKRLADYGSLRLRFKNFDASKNPVLLFIQNNEIVKTLPLTSPEINLSLVLPGDYDLRVLYDRNNNGKWDPGEFFKKHLQPEIVKPLDRKINIRANWDNEFDIAL